MSNGEGVEATKLLETNFDYLETAKFKDIEEEAVGESKYVQNVG